MDNIQKSHYEKYFKEYVKDDEYRKTWNEYKRIQMNNKYQNNEAYREDKKEKRRLLYKKRKEEKLNMVLVN
jgi:hypothetical protein